MAAPELAQIAGHRLETVWHGPAPQDAPTLVLLHEGLGSISMWRDFPERLAAATGCGVLAYSRLGYGRSDPAPLPRPLSYMHDEAAETLPRVLDHFGITRCMLVGHSDGASIAALYAGGTKDARVAGIVLMAPHFIVEEISVTSIAAAKAAYERGDLRQRLARHHGDNVDCAFWGWNGAWLDPAFRDWDIRACLPDIAVPVLVIQGENDEYGTLRQVEIAQSMCGAPVRTAILPACGHSPHRDREEETVHEIALFSRDVFRQAGLAGRAGREHDEG